MSNIATTKGTAVVTLPSDTQILITRKFNAPRDLVYRVFTEPEFIRRWWAGKQGNVTSVDVDLRVGGTWRYVMTTNQGFEVAFHGEYREVVPGQKFVTTEVFEGMPDAEASPTLNEYSFIETHEGTTLELLTRCPDKATRDAIVASGFEAGVQDGYDLAEELAVGLQS